MVDNFVSHTSEPTTFLTSSLLGRRWLRVSLFLLSSWNIWSRFCWYIQRGWSGLGHITRLFACYVGFVHIPCQSPQVERLGCCSQAPWTLAHWSFPNWLRWVTWWCRGSRQQRQPQALPRPSSAAETFRLCILSPPMITGNWITQFDNQSISFKSNSDLWLTK